MASLAFEYLPRPVRRFARRNRPSAWKGLVAGAAAGFVGTIAMTQFQNAWRKMSEKGPSGDSKGGGSGELSRRDQHSKQNETATMKAAGKLARLAGQELTREQRGTASPFIHYGFGTAMGALYGVATEATPRSVRRQRFPFLGGIFGSAVFLGADEIAVPAAGLSQSSTSPSRHLYSWLSHLVYGVTAEFVRRQIRKRI
jgi:hypothetical protein